jgi:hypothetical protein
MPTTKKKKVNKKPTRIKKKDKSQHNPLRNEVLSLIAFVMALFVYISLSRAQGMPEDIQVIGWIGSRLAAGLEKVFGEGLRRIAYMSDQKAIKTATSVPRCTKTSKVKGDSVMANKCWKITKWPELLTGKNSVRPWTIPKMTASSVVKYYPP